MAFTMITLTAGSGFRTATGANAALPRIRARPHVDMVNGTEIVNQEVILPINSSGSATKTLAATTDPATLPVGNYYHFTVEVAGYVVRQFIAALPHNAGSTVALSSLTELTDAPNLTADYHLVALTQAAYNALSPPDPHTLYVVIP